MGLLTAYIIFIIIKQEYGATFGVIGACFFVTSRIIFDATRMVMLEPMMHLCWVLFHFYYYQTLKSRTIKLFLLAGIFLGLSLSIKLTSTILIPFTVLSFLYQVLVTKGSKKDLVRGSAVLIVSSISIAALGYMHLFYSTGLIQGIRETLRAIRDVYLNKSTAGKIHVIGGKVYKHSPWWTYLYFYLQYNGVSRGIMGGVLVLVSFFQRNTFVLYWGTFSILIIFLQQMSGVKNVRYVSSIEIPLIFLLITGLQYLYRKLGQGLVVKIGVMFMLVLSILSLSNYLYSLKFTEYLGLFNYFKKETKSFSDYKRMYVFGSVRSIGWYRDAVPDKSMFLFRKDYDVMCKEFPSFDYFAFDTEEILKDPSNILYRYVISNISSFRKISEITDMLVYKKTAALDVPIDCY